MFWRPKPNRPTLATLDYKHPSAVTFGAYMVLADSQLGLLSVFDDLQYDRADADILSPAMRQHAFEKMVPLGFKQVSGNVLEQLGTGIRCIVPKAYTLGASPFDITRYTPKRAEDFYILTPTQTAGQLVEHYIYDDAIPKIEALIRTQPINLNKLTDYLERKQTHRNFQSAISHLRSLQREVIAIEPLNQRRPLGAFN